MSSLSLKKLSAVEALISLGKKKAWIECNTHPFISSQQSEHVTCARHRGREQENYTVVGKISWDEEGNKRVLGTSVSFSQNGSEFFDLARAFKESLSR